MALTGEEACVQSVNLGLVRDGGWRGWGTKTTYCAPFVPWSDRQGSDTASQDGSPTPHEASRRHQPTLFCFPRRSSAHSVLFISQFPTTIETECTLVSPSRQRVPAGRYTQLSTCLVRRHSVLSLSTSRFVWVLLVSLMQLFFLLFATSYWTFLCKLSTLQHCTYWILSIHIEQYMK